jgi:hypothetical protein
MDYRKAALASSDRKIDVWLVALAGRVCDRLE